MIRIIKGVYGHWNGSKVEPKDRNSEPFSIDPVRESELVAAGVAEYTVDPTPIGFDEQPPEDLSVEESATTETQEFPVLPDDVEGVPLYSIETPVKELRAIAKQIGVKLSVGMTKAEIVAALDAEIDGNMVDGIDEDELPVFDAAEAVE